MPLTSSLFPLITTSKAMAPHSSTLAWKIPWTEEPGRLQSMGSRRVGPDWSTSLSLFTFLLGEGNGNPLQCSCPENPRGRGAWWAAVYEVAQSWTRLKRLGSSSSSFFSLSLNLFCRNIYLHYFLDSTRKWRHTVFVLVWPIPLSIISHGPSMLLRMAELHFLMAKWNSWAYEYIPNLLHPSLCWSAFELLPYLGYCK